MDLINDDGLIFFQNFEVLQSSHALGSWSREKAPKLRSRLVDIFAKMQRPRMKLVSSLNVPYGVDCSSKRKYGIVSMTSMTEKKRINSSIYLEFTMKIVRDALLSAFLNIVLNLNKLPLYFQSVSKYLMISIYNYTYCMSMSVYMECKVSVLPICTHMTLWVVGYNLHRCREWISSIYL